MVWDRDGVGGMAQYNPIYCPLLLEWFCQLWFCQQGEDT